MLNIAFVIKIHFSLKEHRLPSDPDCFVCDNLVILNIYHFFNVSPFEISAVALISLSLMKMLNSIKPDDKIL